MQQFTKPALIEMIDSLIKTPSVSCVSSELDMSNLPVIEQLANWLQPLGFTTEIQTLKDPNKANLIATLGSGSGGLVLSGHTDTVPCDESLWTTSPFQLTARDNRLYGLGTADMKSFLALAIEAASRFDSRRFQQPLIILATADEETSMAGAKAIAESGYPKARFAVIGEPTGLKPIRAHKGMMMESIRLTGQAGHSSNPDLGHNALEAMHQVMTELMRWRQELQAKHKNAFFEIPVPTMNFGHIHGGDNPNRICGSCELHIDIRPLPGMKLLDLRLELKTRLKQLLRNQNIRLQTLPLFEGIDAVETPAESELVKICEQLTGHSAASVAFATEAPFYQQMGMDAVVLGPGCIDQAHQPDEFIKLDSIKPGVDMLEKLIAKFCL
ncbi:MAG: acetylornithine deacetylase [Gammaproteobacteria bacterium]|nr:acetylornithine deacetylase [Gammaproteobacteria bacterium]